MTRRDLAPDPDADRYKELERNQTIAAYEQWMADNGHRKPPTA